MGPRLSGSRWLHSARAAGRPIDWARSPTFHKLQTKVNFFFIRRGRGPRPRSSLCFGGWGRLWLAGARGARGSLRRRGTRVWLSPPAPGPPSGRRRRPPAAPAGAEIPARAGGCVDADGEGGGEDRGEGCGPQGVECRQVV